MRVQKSEHFQAFDWMRLALAIFVIRSHYGIFTRHGQIYWDVLIPVPMFLAISGFVVLGSFERSGSWLIFAWRRVCRVVPLFLVSLIAVLLLWGPSGVAGNLANYATMGFSPAARWDNGSVWSLGAEELAYALLAILFMAGAYRTKWPIWILWGISAVFMFAVDRPDLVKVSVPLYLNHCLPFAFFTGNLCYLFRDRLRGLGWHGVALCIAGSACASQYLFAWSVLLSAPGILLLALYFRPKPIKRDFSYGLYIWNDLWLHALPSMKYLALAGTILTAILSERLCRTSIFSA
jgi:peptidoglycan/LPS O-acetylase OafA/YrhL